MTRVEVAVIHPSALKLELTLPGEVEGVRDAELGAALGGFVERVLVDVGARVREGQPLVLIDTASHGARLRHSKVELDVARVEVERYTQLGGAIASAELDAARARLALVEASIRSQQVQAARATVVAPFDGVVVDVRVEVGEVAPPGAAVLRLVKLDPAKVTVSLSDRAVLSVREGMEAVVTADARATPMKGKVARVHRAADANTRAFLADIHVDNAGEVLLPGMIASVRLQSDVSDGDRLVVPQDWLVTRLDSVGAFVDQGGVASWRSLQLGPIADSRVVIESGLKEGDRVVITGHRELVDGDKLLVAREGRCCTEGRVVYAEGAAKDQAEEVSGEPSTATR